MKAQGDMGHHFDDAFVARFSRLQDTLGDKLLPALLKVLDGRRP